jgi:hypothetical protein
MKLNILECRSGVKGRGEIPAMGGEAQGSGRAIQVYPQWEEKRRVQVGQFRCTPLPPDFVSMENKRVISDPCPLFCDAWRRISTNGLFEYSYSSL